MKYLGKIENGKDLLTREYAEGYGVCDTAAATAAKVVTVAGITELHEGLAIRVKFTNAQTHNGAPTLNVNSLGAKNIRRNGTTNAARYEWLAGEVVDLVYDGTAWLIADGGVATTTYYGATKLATSAVSTSTALALTPASLNSLAQYMIAGVGVYSTSATYSVGDRVRYGYYIYECNTAITTAEAWNAEHWTALSPLLDLIEDKYTKPSGGIPASDLASGVIPSVPSASTTTPAMDGTASAGSSTSFARGDHVHPTDTSRATATSVPASAAVGSNGLITFKNSSGTQLFTVQLPLYTGGVS